ncbi:MAG: carboxylesterase family protein [Dehalococcoidia bacterium]|nr:carboxylesterase family protein [Dehalococcoidia bacterium]
MRCRGTHVDGVDVFRGIPYARPPVGELRFAAPQPPEPWSETRDATEPGPCCYVADTSGNPVYQYLGHSYPRQDEDCLNLNIWTPGADGRRRPVMVWIHGGAFVTGSGSLPMYDGESLCRNGDVVVVTINYRLGAFGFLRLGDTDGEGTAGTGNEGLLDQVAALEWVPDQGIGHLRRRRNEHHRVRGVRRGDQHQRDALHAGDDGTVPEGDPAERRAEPVGPARRSR